MALPVSLQLARACAAVVCGAALGFFYELLRLPRLLFPGRAAAAVCDLVFCLGAAAALFTLGLGPGGGQLRLYMCAFAAAGFVLWRAAPGRLMARGEARLAALARRAARFCLQKLRSGAVFAKKLTKSAKKYLHFGKDGLQ